MIPSEQFSERIQLSRRVPTPASRAQSDLIGITLLIGVVVAVVALVGFLILFGGSGAAENPKADLNVSVTAGTIAVTHKGGDELRAEDIRVIIQPRDGDSKILTHTGSGDFGVGDTLQWAHDNSGQSVTVRVVDGATNTVIHEEWLDIPATSAGLRAAFIYSPSTPKTGETVSFDGSPSANPGSEITSYEWDLGDGTTTTGQTTSHTYGDDGTYTATLTVSGPDGDTRTSTESIVVHNVPPTVSASATPTDSSTDETVTFSASAADSDGSVASYEWDFGDGTTASGQTVTHSYDTGGSYTATVTVTDDDGATNTDSVTVTASAAPTATFSVSPSNPTTQNVEFDASGSTDPDGSVVSYEWDLGDGNTATGQTITPTYSDDGTYTVTLTVTDDDGKTATATQDVTVANVAPTAEYTAYLDDTDNDGTDEIVYDGSAASDPDGSIQTYRWIDASGNVLCETGQPVCSVSQGLGTDYADVTLEVVDDDGATASETKANQPQPTPGFEVFGVLLAVLVGGLLRRRATDE